MASEPSPAWDPNDDKTTEALLRRYLREEHGQSPVAVQERKELFRRLDALHLPTLMVAFRLRRTMTIGNDAGGFINHYIREWLNKKIAASGLTPDVKDLYLREANRLLREEGSHGRGMGLAILTDPRLQDRATVEKLLVEACENPAWDDIHLVASEQLADFQKDLSLARRWLKSDSVHLWKTGWNLLVHIDYRNLAEGTEKALKEREALLVGIARRKELPPELAEAIAHWIWNADNPELKPVLDAMARHPNPKVQKSAADALARLK